VINFDTLRRTFDSDSAIRASSRGAKQEMGERGLEVFDLLISLPAVGLYKLKAAL